MAAAVGLLVVACDATTPDGPAPPPDDEPAEEEPADDEPADDEPRDGEDPPEDEPAADGDPPPDDPSAGSAVELTAWVDEAPANLNHRIEATVTEDVGDDGFGVPVRFEVHRDDTIALAVDRQTEADGEVLFSYNAGARAGGSDVVVACAVDPEDAASGEVGAGTSLCTETSGEGRGSPEDPTDDPVAGSATVTWGEERQADPDPAGSDFFGEAISVDREQQVLEVQLLPRDADLGSFVSFDYSDDADYEVEGEPVSMELFACAVQRTVDDDAAEQRLTVSLTPPEVMRYLLTTSTTVDACV